MNKNMVVGIDEVGRGAWAGPLVVGAVIFREGCQIDGLTDSKLLTPNQRERLVPIIQSVAVAWAIGVVEVQELDSIGLGASLGLAAQRAVEALVVQPSSVLIDGKYPYRNFSLKQQPIIGGDKTVLCISAASVVAKVLRDQMMFDLHKSDATVRSFRFDLNKGCPSALHRSVLTERGPSIHHRQSFAPIRRLLDEDFRTFCPTSQV